MYTVSTVLYTVPYADEEVNHEEEGKQRLVEVESKAYRVNGDAESASGDNVQHEKSSHPHGTTVYVCIAFATYAYLNLNLMWDMGRSLLFSAMRKRHDEEFI